MEEKKVATDYHFITTSFKIDRKLYKYYSNTDYAIDCIKNKRIHLDDPKRFNDPFDAVYKCPPVSWIPAFKSEKEMADMFYLDVCLMPRALHGKHHSEIVSEMTAFFNSTRSYNLFSSEKTTETTKGLIRKFYLALNSPSFSVDEFEKEIDAGFIEKNRVMPVNCRIACFSEICDSILMWSYYANCHNGICIEFNLSKLDSHSELNNQILNCLTKVHYSPLRTDVQYFGASHAGLSFLTSKADVWQHEQEWRLICDTDEEYMPFDCISNVYIGAKFRADDSQKNGKYARLIKAVNEHPGLAICQCKLSKDKYQIEFEEIYRNLPLSNWMNKSEAPRGALSTV